MTKFYDTTNFMLSVLLESRSNVADIYQAIGGLGNHSGIANWMNTWNK